MWLYFHFAYIKKIGIGPIALTYIWTNLEFNWWYSYLSANHLVNESIVNCDFIFTDCHKSTEWNLISAPSMRWILIRIKSGNFLQVKNYHFDHKGEKSWFFLFQNFLEKQTLGKARMDHGKLAQQKHYRYFQIIPLYLTIDIDNSLMGVCSAEDVDCLALNFVIQLHTTFVQVFGRSLYHQ